MCQLKSWRILSSHQNCNSFKKSDKKDKKEGKSKQCTNWDRFKMMMQKMSLENYRMKLPDMKEFPRMIWEDCWDNNKGWRSWMNMKRKMRKKRIRRIKTMRWIKNKRIVKKIKYKKKALKKQPNQQF